VCSILVVDDHADTRCVIAELVGMISATIEREAPTPVLPAKAFLAEAAACRFDRGHPPVLRYASRLLEGRLNALGGRPWNWSVC